jgi:hypothetical protein
MIQAPGGQNSNLYLDIFSKTSEKYICGSRRQLFSYRCLICAALLSDLSGSDEGTSLLNNCFNWECESFVVQAQGLYHKTQYGRNLRFL